MSSARTALGLAIPLAFAGCGAPDGDGSGSAFVFFDSTARASGLAIVADGEVLPATSLPMEVDAPASAALARLPQSRPPRPEERLPAASQLSRIDTLELEPGAAVHVRGSDGSLLRGPADPDQIMVSGSESAAIAFASLFGAYPFRDNGEPASLGGTERWIIRAPDVLSLAALLEERQLEAIEAVAPIYAAGDTADEQRAELDRLHDDETAAAAERQAIRRDLAVVITLDGPNIVELGRGIPIEPALVNRSSRPRAVVRPGDGSNVGWREPYIRWSAERELQPGVWQAVPERRYLRCGNYDADWQKDAILLEPGQSLPFEWRTPVEAALDLGAAGNYRIYAHYEYRAGLLGRGPFGISDASESANRAARLLEGVPSYEVVSAPVEIRIEAGLELSLRR